MRHPRPVSPRRLSALAGAFAAGLALGGPAAAEPNPCRADAVRHLERIGVDPGDVADMAMVRIISQPEVGATIEVQAWASLKSCPGAVVVKLTPICRVKETYTRGGCEISGVTHF